MSEAAPDIYQPGIPFEEIGSSKFLQEQLRKRDQAAKQLTQLQANEKLSIKKFVKSPLGIAIIVFFFVLLIIYIANPPFTQKNKDSPLEEGSPSLLKSLVTALIFAIIVYVAPMIYKKLTQMENQ